LILIIKRSKLIDPTSNNILSNTNITNNMCAYAKIYVLLVNRQMAKLIIECIHVYLRIRVPHDINTRRLNDMFKYIIGSVRVRL